jgi:glycosyltransferase involved in cell wall biosynthesis
MRICLICTEIFAWGKYGGFGRATRTIGRELAKRGVRVFAVVPRRGEQRPVEELDGITVLGFPSSNPLRALQLFRETDADIFHSSEPSLGTYLAQRSMPDRLHVITFRDPRDRRDWLMEFALPSLSRWQVIGNYLYESNFLIGHAVRRADALFSIARYLIPKITRMYGLQTGPTFLPTPIAIPERVDKASEPTVCYLARLDRRKRPELFLNLARQFPDVRFIAFGASRDSAYDRALHAAYGHLPNLEMTGFVDQFQSGRHSEILGKSWVMVNTATREALPNAFLEAAAHRCAILAGLDPDGFASRFGYHAAEEDFARGLAWLLENDRWRAQGEAGCAYVRETFEMSRAIQLHLDAYRDLLKTRRHGQTVGRAAEDAI